MLQQYLPFTVLKLSHRMTLVHILWTVATVLTVYGIETARPRTSFKGRNKVVATVLTVYGIETFLNAYHYFL